MEEGMETDIEDINTFKRDSIYSFSFPFRAGILSVSKERIKYEVERIINRYDLDAKLIFLGGIFLRDYAIRIRISSL